MTAAAVRKVKKPTPPASLDWLAAAIERACMHIAPGWPLDQMIAVNPYWGYADTPFTSTAEQLAVLAGTPLTMPLAYYREHWLHGRITSAALHAARAEFGNTFSNEHLIALLQAPDAPLPAPPLLSDILDDGRQHRHEPIWRHTIRHQIGQFCAAYFDDDQADVHPPERTGLYTNWCEVIRHDHSVSLLMKTPDLASRGQLLAADPVQQIHNLLNYWQLTPETGEPLLHAALLQIGGWAAWCAYRRWQARLRGEDDPSVIELLAIRLSWEALLDDGNRQPGSNWHRWHQDWHAHLQRPLPENWRAAQIWQRAHEISYQQQLVQTLSTASATRPADAVTTPQRASVQAVFCIDVRSEVFRRQFEAQSPQIQTLGFAGFFGLPIQYQPLGSALARPQLPGLLAASLTVSDSSGDALRDQQLLAERLQAMRNASSWRPFERAPTGSFSLVETLGLGYLGSLVQRSLGWQRQPNAGRNGLRPTLTHTDDSVVLAKMVAHILTGMTLTESFAPLVLLIGHGSQTVNNPQRAGLDCGACCGQTGEVNARLLASLLNTDAVRAALPAHGIHIPADTRFVAGLHNTTTEEITLFDCADLPASRNSALRDAQAWLQAAGAAARRERAASIGLQAIAENPSALVRAMRARANDWAETRPEWGLANNAAFIIAPRSRTYGRNLEGRSFLHDYHAERDPDGRILEQILTAPMLVTNWINMQYYASTVDNQRYGSGNKTLHNVVGGRIGVFEGNGGDLRLGLAWQSVHDGRQFRHEPLRLSVVIDAPRQRIEQIIATHAIVRNLVNQQWLYLLRWQDDGIECYQHDRWQRWTGHDAN